MTTATQSQEIDEDQFHDLIAEYLRRIDCGEAVDRAAFVVGHPKFAASLQAYFENEDAIDAMANAPADGLTHPIGTRSVSEATTAGATESIEDQETPQIPETFGRYRVLKALGHGAMGAVYLAQDQQLGRPVALKIPKFNKTDTSGTLERFYREARSAALLRHPNICPVFDVGEIDGQHYISMAFIEGRPLSDLIRAGQLQSETQVAVIVRKLALGLADAHAHGVIHRDLKPANIMIDSQGEPVVMDFGLAHCATQQELKATQEGAIIGTIAYMSPEQSSGDRTQIGPGADIYSLGVILYEVLTGHVPFTGDLLSVLKQIAVDEPKPPSQWRPRLDSRLEAICLKMLAKLSADRYASMIEVAQALAAYLAMESKTENIELGSTATQRRTLKRRIFQHWIVTAAMMAATILGAAAIILNFRNDAGPLMKNEVTVSKDREMLPILVEPIASNAIDPVATDSAAAVLPEETPMPLAADRAAAEWVLEIKGNVSIRTDSGTLLVKTRAELPEESFAVLHIDFGFNNQLIFNLKKLAGLGSLEELRIQGRDSSIRDNMLDVLPELPSLRRLFIYDAPITNLEMISRCRNLETLDIYTTLITDAGFREIRNLSKLKNLTMSNQVTNDGLDPLAECRALEHISFLYSPVTAAGLRKLAGLPKLRILWLWNCGRVADAEMEELRRFLVLEELSLSKTAVSDAGIQLLATLPRLSNLDASGTNITDVGLRSLATFPRLSILSAGRTKITDAGLANLANNSNLVILFLIENAQISDEGMAHVARIPNLRTLSLIGTPVSNDGLKQLESLKSLREIQLNDTKVTAEGVAALKKALSDCNVLFSSDKSVSAEATDSAAAVLPKEKPMPLAADRAAAEWVLEIKGNVSIRTASGTRLVKTCAELPEEPFAVSRIDLSDNQRIFNLEKLAGLGALEELKIQGRSSSIRDDMLGVLPELPSLRRLLFYDAPITDLAMISRCRNLEHLDILSTLITDAGFREIRNLTNLKDLTMSNSVTNDGLDPLAECRALERICFAYSPVTAAGLRKLAGLPKLRILWLWNCAGVADAEMEEMQYFPALEGLTLIGTAVGDAGIPLLATHPRLLSLNLESTKITDAALQSLVTFPQLSALFVGHTKITDAGMVHMARMPNLLNLDLSGTAVTDDGLKQLSSLKSLRQLDLKDTKVTAGGVAALKKALPDCNVLFSASKPASAQ